MYVEFVSNVLEIMVVTICIVKAPFSYFVAQALLFPAFVFGGDVGVDET